MRGKRGQFYLLGAAMIIGLLFGLSVVGNKISVAGEKASISKLAREVKLETGEVVASNLYTRDQMPKQDMENWIGNYSDYSLGIDHEAEWAFVYGKDTFELVTIEKESIGGTSGVGVGVENVKRVKKKEEINPNGGKLKPVFKEKDYEFPARNGEENFYFVLNSKDKSGEYVEKG